MQETPFLKLKIPDLAKALNLTKGSFYHHFKNKDQYLHSVLKFWETHTTKKVMIHIPRMKGSLREKLRELEIFLHEHDILLIERSIRLSIASELVQNYTKQMDHIRIKLIAQFFLDEGYPIEDAKFKSRMIYNIHIAEITSFNLSAMGPLPINEIDKRLDFYLN